MKEYGQINLVTIEGDSINIEYPDEIIDEIFEEIRNTLLTGESWNVGNWTEVRVKFKGNRLDNINMKLIIGFY